ncbi:hypothetical protein FisN_2Lh348 [Fistulifera solaris]|uniref:Uncharacterized protein n=1 Tax=Fistulifera solaris TaxID=1519565 RepID=A0A1Z5J7Z8_FISSO|nr:hypothetical protein FisN_2Lh348 [Fistulifera solaris]|eukprot:GAX10079.1 hypothetical protein FisN_2Lh348 [Fistulifera solaris]
MTTQQPSASTINVFKAYLNPLLKKHESGKVIVYEDLVASWEAVEAVLSKHESSPDANDAKEKIKALHDEQVLEYKKAGKRALIEYCRTCSLPAGDSSDPNHTLKCIRHALNGIPNWKLPRSLVLSVLQKGIQERLSTTSSPTPASPTKPPAPTPTPAPTSLTPLAIKPSAKVVSKQNEPAVTSIVEEGEEVETPVEEAAPASADEGEIEEGEEVEEEEDEEDEEDAEGEAADEDNTEKKGNASKTKGLLAKRRALGKMAGPKKKGTAAKGGRSGARGRIVRRGGRSGGKA